MSTDTDQDYEHDHDWWEYFYDFYPDPCADEETPEEARKRIKKEREDAYERAMGVL